MLGAIAGDIIGSVYEADNLKSTDFPLFHRACRYTDDTVLTVAVADAILEDGDYETNLKHYAHLYPNAGYGMHFMVWARRDRKGPYNSWGNGAAMRVSPVGFAFETLDEVLAEAERTAAVTHNHPEGIKGAQSTAAAVFLARTGHDREAIRKYITETFGYNLDTPLDVIRPQYRFDISCQGTVPVAFRAFLESTDYEDAVRKAISVGGDSDTIACITGGIAQAFYGGVPDAIAEQALDLLDARLREVTLEFRRVYGCGGW